MKPLKILFFINDSAPTLDETLAADEIGQQVCFRNARYIPTEGALEACDGVAGDVPKRYAEAFPTAEAAIEKRRAEIEALLAKTGDSPAPTTAAMAAVNAPDAQQAATPDAGAGDASKPAPGPAPAGNEGAAWKAN